jgi:hypothetical protein
MPELFLTGGRILEITEEQSMTIAKAMMLLPEWKQLKIGDVVFRLDEIDHEAKRLSKLPKQEHFDIRVPVVDVEKKTRKTKKSIDNWN